MFSKEELLVLKRTTYARGTELETRLDRFMKKKEAGQDVDKEIDGIRNEQKIVRGVESKIRKELKNLTLSEMCKNNQPFQG